MFRVLRVCSNFGLEVVLATEACDGAAARRIFVRN